MKIPNSIRIGGVEYEVEFVPNLRNATELLYGEINYHESKISISTTDGAGHQMQCITLLHEILHGIQNHSGIELPKDKEEQIIDMFARGMYQVLQDNGNRLFDIKDQWRLTEDIKQKLENLKEFSKE